MAKAADELGLMLWEEVPVYWSIQRQNPDTLAIARNQISRLVQRDWNRASVVIWSVANETPHSEPRLAFLRTLIDDVRGLDDTRLVSAALFGNPQAELREIALHLASRGLSHPDASERDKAIFNGILSSAGEHAPSASETFKLTISDPLGEYVDIVGYNEYFGWYYPTFFARSTGVSEALARELELDFMSDIELTTAFKKPLFISEMGAGALAGKMDNEVFSEQYQDRVYQAQIGMLRNSSEVQGMTPWILKDFRAMLRPLPGIQDYRNRKGLIDENGRRKLAFKTLQTFYAGPWEDAIGNE